jgi:hypothetical protein
MVRRETDPTAKAVPIIRKESSKNAVPNYDIN